MNLSERSEPLRFRRSVGSENRPIPVLQSH